MVALKLPKHTEETQPKTTEGDGHHSKKRRMDILGITFLGSAVSSFILLCSAFTEKSSLNEIKWELVAALILFGALFAIDEAFWAEDPLIPLELAVTNGIGIAWTAQSLLNIATFSVSQEQCLFYITPADIFFS